MKTLISPGKYIAELTNLSPESLTFLAIMIIVNLALYFLSFVRLSYSQLDFSAYTTQVNITVGHAYHGACFSNTALK